MKKLSYAFFFSILMLSAFTANSYTLGEEHDSAERWERIAWSALEEKYKGAQLEDYEYVGRTEVNDEQAKDVFRVTVNQESKTFSAHAEVYFHPVTHAIISVQIFPL
ncbi:YqzG/YhdC family protein [Bacillus swezeyi]|uniref:YqzG/YhdC family protein n=1 Tax=Bacillus swezeyi TaxID=1925020 RepID=UPI003F893454